MCSFCDGSSTALLHLGFALVIQILLLVSFNGATKLTKRYQTCGWFGKELCRTGIMFCISSIIGLSIGAFTLIKADMHTSWTGSIWLAGLLHATWLARVWILILTELIKLIPPRKQQRQLHLA
jgi:hypothetical protein